MFQSERFSREAGPTISQAVSPPDAARDVTWIAATIEFARRGHVVTGVDFNGALDGTPFSLDASRLVIVARK